MDRVITGSKTQEQAEILYERVKPLEKDFENLYQISMDPSLSYKEKDSVVREYSSGDATNIKNKRKVYSRIPEFLRECYAIKRL